MIDAKDKGTQALPLEEMPIKRKRGRPATGKAMTPAEKQRAYRERQKQSRDQNSVQTAGEYSAERFEELRLITVEISERCMAAEARVAELEKANEELRKTREALEALAARQLRLEDELNGHFKRANKAEARVAELEKELKSRDQKSISGNALEEVTENKCLYTLQKKSPAGRWRTVCTYETSAEANTILNSVEEEFRAFYRIRKAK